jgi:hypothetical protein
MTTPTDDAARLRRAINAVDKIVRLQPACFDRASCQYELDLLAEQLLAPYCRLLQLATALGLGEPPHPVGRSFYRHEHHYDEWCWAMMPWKAEALGRLEFEARRRAADTPADAGADADTADADAGADAPPAPPADGTIRDGQVWVCGYGLRLTSRHRELLRYLLTNDGATVEAVQVNLRFKGPRHVYTSLTRLRDRLKTECREYRLQSELTTQEGHIRVRVRPLPPPSPPA